MVMDHGNDLGLNVLISLTILLSIHEEKCKQTNILMLKNIPILMTVTFVRVIKSRRMRWAGHVARMRDRRGVYRVWVGKSERKRQIGTPRRRLEDNIKMDLQEVIRGVMDWLDLAQDRDRWRTLVSAVMNLRVPSNVGNFLTS